MIQLSNFGECLSVSTDLQSFKLLHENLSFYHHLLFFLSSRNKKKKIKIKHPQDDSSLTILLLIFQLTILLLLLLAAISLFCLCPPLLEKIRKTKIPEICLLFYMQADSQLVIPRHFPRSEK